MSRRRPARRESTAPKGAGVSKEVKAPREEKTRDVFVARPFEGLAAEADWVALRELVPAATAPLQLGADLRARYGPRTVTLATVLPMAWPALTKPDGRIFLGLQRNTRSGDVSRDLAVALLAALDAEPGGAVDVPALPGPGPRLQDLLAGDPLDIAVETSFDFWLDEDGAERAAGDPAVSASLERANASVFPTVRMDAAPAAYWCQFSARSHVRWVLPDGENDALPALARLAAAGELGLGAASTRFAGMFRAHGLLVPVWDLPREAPASDWEEPLGRLAQRYALARAEGGELDAAQRRSRQGLVGRQLTLR